MRKTYCETCNSENEVSVITHIAKRGMEHCDKCGKLTPHSFQKREKPSMLFDLLQQVKAAATLSGIDAVRFELNETFKPNVHMRIGDFEIRCLKPEKYNL